MITVKKQFYGEGAGMDGDSSPKKVAPNGWLNLMNGRVAVSQNGRDYRIENVKGTEAIVQSVHPAGTNICIGGAHDEKRDRLVYCLHNSNGDHAIFVFDKSSGTTYKVILNSQVEDGLNFSKSYRIDRNARVIGDLFVFTDNNQDIFCINLEAGIKLNHPTYDTEVEAYDTPILNTSITLIKRPPAYSLSVSKENDASFPNSYIADVSMFFCYRYQYKEYQVSALSSYSSLININTATDNYNYVSIEVPFAEQIDDDVRVVELIVKYGSTGKSFVIKRFDKDRSADAAAIAAHNAGTTNLSHDFYNTVNGTALSDVDSVNNFDLIPLRAKTIDLANLRLFMGNILAGYDTPLTTSLTAEVNSSDTGSSGEWDGEWGYVTLHANLIGDCQDTYMYPFVYSETAPSKFYFFPNARVNSAWNGGTHIADLKATENILDATVTANTEAEFVTTLKLFSYPTSSGCPVDTPTWQTSYEILYDAFGASSDVTMYSFSASSVTSYFKTGGQYNLSIAFYDKYRRKCGVVDAPYLVSIDDRLSDQTTFSASITWLLSNTNRLTEIPEWAYYYQIHITKNLRTRFFLQAATTTAHYVVKNQDGTFDYANDTFAATGRYGTAFDISSLTTFGFGYTFQEGDVINIYDTTSAGNLIGLPILAVDGNYVIFKNTDLGALGTSLDFLFEINTPYKPSLTEPFYETGPVYAVANAGTSGRAYSVITDVISGDVYSAERDLDSDTTYITETMSPNDKLWKVWETNTGWVNFVDTVGQQQKLNTIAFTDTFVAGARLNGLNKVQVSASKNVENEAGEIQKLQMATRVSEQGHVMLCICTTQVFSIYLGVVQVTTESGSSYLAKTDGIIGSVNPIKSLGGTTHPETVISYLGLIYWADLANGMICQYSANGIDDQSRYKMTRFFKNYFSEYQRASANNLDNINGFHHLPTAIDPFSKEFLITCPGLIYENYASTLPSYSSVPDYATSILYRFDVYDKLAKTMALQIESNAWGSNYEYAGEFYDYLSGDMYGFKNGILYKFNSDSAYNKFFGTYKPIRLCVVLNEVESGEIDLANIAIEGSDAPTFTVAYSSNPDVQITDLTDESFQKEGTAFFATFFGDRLSPNIQGDAAFKMNFGDVITGYPIYLMLEWDINYKLVYVDAVNIGFNLSKGLRNLIKQK